MAVTFAGGLRNALRGRTDRWSKRVLAIVDGPDSRLQRWFLRRAEEDARLHLGLGDKVGIDWSKIDWNKALDFLLKLAAIILPLLLAKKSAAKTPASTVAWKKSLGRTGTRKRL